MKAEIDEGYLIIIPANKTEEYAIETWFAKECVNTNPCKGEITTSKIGYSSIKKESFRKRFYMWWKGIYKFRALFR